MDGNKPNVLTVAGLTLLWAVGSFVYFKVSLDAAFRSDATVTAALLLGVLTAVTIYFNGFFYATKLGQHLARVRLGKASGFFGPALSVWAVSAVANSLMAKLLIFGFSKRLNRELGNDILFDSYRAEEGILFLALVLVPLVLQLFLVVISANTQAAAIDIDTVGSSGASPTRQAPSPTPSTTPPGDSKTVQDSTTSAGLFSQPIDAQQMQNIALGIRYAMLDAQSKRPHLPRIGEPPWDQVIEWYSWDGMPVVVVRNPSSGGLKAWSSADPGDPWRTVDVLDVASEARKLSESDWKAAFERWFPNPSLHPK